jgi:hypothetical protein
MDRVLTGSIQSDREKTMEMGKGTLEKEERQNIFDYFLYIMAAVVFASVGISFLLWLMF